MRHLRLPPAETAATLDDSPETPMGVRLDAVEPVPSSPESLRPQHFAALFGPVTAHVWPKPAEIDKAVDGDAADAAGPAITP